MRLFIGIPLSGEAKREIEKFFKILKKKHWEVKWEEIEKIHSTLAFLGNIRYQKLNIKDADEISKENKLWLLKKIVEKSCEGLQSIKVGFKGLGCFPDYDFPRIIWLGLKGDLYSLSFLQKRIKENLAKAGFVFDNKPFVPHLTLGRIKRARLAQRREIGRQIRAMREIDFKNDWLIDEVTVYESRCFPEGSKYFKLFPFRLKNLP